MCILRTNSDERQADARVSRGMLTRLFFRLDGRKHEEHQKLCEPMGLYSGVRRFSGRHGERLGLSQQAGQQRRRGIPAHLSAVYFHFLLCGSARGIRHGPPRGDGHTRRV